MQKKEYIIKINEKQVGLRLDIILSKTIEEVSRSKIKQYIKLGFLSRKDSNLFWIAHKSFNNKVKLNEKYKLLINEQQDQEIKPMFMELDILYEDKYLAVINKPANLTVHPGAGNKDNTLVNALVAKFGTELSDVSGVTRLGIVHRLDKNTSGVMVIAKNSYVHNKLSEQFSEHTIKRNYRALVWGIINPNKGIIENIIGRSISNRKKMVVLNNCNRGKKAITIYKTLKISHNKMFSLIDCELKTGRTHQIRVHFSNINHPIVGDDTYGNRKKYKHISNNIILDKIKILSRQALHAYKLEFIHPINHQIMKFEKDEDDTIQSLYNVLF